MEQELAYRQGNIKMIYIGFSGSKDWLSNLIRVFTKGKFSHAFLAYDDPVVGCKMVMEAQWDGFHVKKLSKSPSSGGDMLLLQPKHDISNLPKVCSNWLGDPYDYTGFLGAIPVMISRFFNKKSKNMLSDAKAKFCSEAIALGLQEIKYPGADKLIPDQTTPQDLLNFFENEK